MLLEQLECLPADPIFGCREADRVSDDGQADWVLELVGNFDVVEVFVNGRSLGIEIAPPMRYDLSSHLIQGENLVAIEVATTLERQAFPLLDDYGKKVTRPPSGKSGLTGTVRLYG